MSNNNNKEKELVVVGAALRRLHRVVARIKNATPPAAEWIRGWGPILWPHQDWSLCRDQNTGEPLRLEDTGRVAALIVLALDDPREVLRIREEIISVTEKLYSVAENLEIEAANLEISRLYKEETK
jgi:hypothetical protein